MTTEQIYKKIQEIVAEQKGEAVEISPDLSIAEQIAEDSVEVMEFVLTLEDEFHIDISDEAIEGFESLADVVFFIESRLNVR